MSVLIKLSKSNQRNAAILSEIIALAEEGKQIIVFACSVEHANLLSELLILKNIKSHCIDSNTQSFDRIRFVEEFKKEAVKVLVNYGVLTTGFDAPNTNAVVITRPTTSLVLYSQMIGRGIRGPKMGGTIECIIVDIEDNLINLPSEQTAFNYFNSHWEITNA
jgi:superfamily II DNA or RNA helicase